MMGEQAQGEGRNNSDFAGVLLLYEFCSCNALHTGKLHHVHAARQAGYVNLRLGLGDLAGDEFLPVEV